jgi:DNA repair protein RadC
MSEHQGHRQRLIAKLEDGILYEHEYLEALLFNAQPRKNTNSTAHRLLAEFGSVENVFHAPIAELAKVQGVGINIASYIHCVGRLCGIFPKVRKEDYPETYEHKNFLSYVKTKYKGCNVERLDVYCLDANLHIYESVTFTDSEAGKVNLSGEDLSEMLARERPSGVVVVHNHPLGSARPSDADNATTKRLRALCSTHNVLLCDHYLYAPDGVFSYREGGKLHKITEEALKKV